MYSGHQRAHEDEGFNPFQSQSAHLPNSRPSGMIEANRVPSRLPEVSPPRLTGPPPPPPTSQPIYGGVGPYDIDPLDPTPYPGYPTEPQGADQHEHPQGPPPPSQQRHYQNAPQHDASSYAPSISSMQNPRTHPMYNHPEQRPVDLSQRQLQQQPAHAPFVTTNNHAPARTAPYQAMHGVPRTAWFANDNISRIQQHPTYIPGPARQNHPPYQFHARDASVSSSSSATDAANLDSPMGPSSSYGSPAEIDQSHSYALQQYAPPSQAPPNVSASDPIVGAVPSEEEQSSTDDGNAVALNTVLPHTNTMFVDGIPVPPHQQYYPRSAWGPPPPRKVVQARMEEQRRLQQAHTSAVRSGGSSDVSLSNTVNPAALGGSGSKRKQPPESDGLAGNGNVEMTNPTSGDLDNLVDGYTDNEKPPYPLSTILKFTLLGSPRGKLTLAEIYETLMARFPFFKHVKTDWQNSVRHTLSLHVCFVRVARAITDPGKGSYWTYEPSRGDGINRKRKPKKKKGAVDEESYQAREYIEVRDSSPDDATHDDDRTARLPETSTSSAVKSHRSSLGVPNQPSVRPITDSNPVNAATSATMRVRDGISITPRAVPADTLQRSVDRDHDMDVDQELVFMAWGPTDPSASTIPASALASPSVPSHLAPGPSRGALDQLEYSSSSGSTTDRGEGNADNGYVTRESASQSESVEMPHTSSRRRHMTEQDEREAETLRQRGLGELVALRQARKEQGRHDGKGAAQRQDPVVRGSGDRAEPSWSDDEPGGPSSVNETVPPQRRTSSRARTAHSESGKSSLATSTYSTASANKYLPVQRTPPPEHLQQLQQIHQSWNGRFVMGVPVSMPPSIPSRLPIGNTPQGTISPAPNSPIPHAYSPVSPQPSPVRPKQSTSRPSPIVATVRDGTTEPAVTSAAPSTVPSSTQQQPPVTSQPASAGARTARIATQSHDPVQFRPRPRPQSHANTQALARSLSSQSTEQTQEYPYTGDRISPVGEPGMSTTQTSAQGSNAQHEHSVPAKEAYQQLQAQWHADGSDPLLDDTAANRAYIAQLDPSKIKRGPSGRARIPIDPQAIARIKAQKAAQQQRST